MDAYIFDQDLNSIAIIDTYKSFIWTDRYLGCGDFEIYIPATTKMLDVLKKDNYLSVEESDRTMVIESIELEENAEDGDYLIVTGRSLESLLERRIIWGQKVLHGNFQSAIKELLNENAISPTNQNRKIPRITFRDSDNASITALTVDTQFFGDNLYEAVYALCKEKDVGFKIVQTDAGAFEFSLYLGTDRSYAQEVNPWVVFSLSLENLLTSNYLESDKTLRTVSMAAGEGEGSSRRLVEVQGSDTGTFGLSRRELYTDASDISATHEVEQTVTDPNTGKATTETVEQKFTDEEYDAQLTSKGKEDLATHLKTKTFESEIDATRQFVYGRDFTIGDIVQIVSKYGMESVSRVSEVVHSHSPSDSSITPTFTAMDGS